MFGQSLMACGWHLLSLSFSSLVLFNTHLSVSLYVSLVNVAAIFVALGHRVTLRNYLQVAQGKRKKERKISADGS